MGTARATRATPTRLHARAVLDPPAEPPSPEQAEPATALRGEYLTEQEYQALLALARSGRLPPDAASIWPGEGRTRWMWAKVAGGLVVWVLAGAGLWCLVT